MAIKTSFPVVSRVSASRSVKTATTSGVSTNSTTKQMSISDLADGSKFRSLPEVEKYLDSVLEKVSSLDNLLKQYQLQFARVSGRSELSTVEFVINPDSGPSGKGTGKKLKLDQSVDIKVPRMDLLQKNFAVVEELAEQVNGLTSLYNSVTVNFRNIRGSSGTLDSIKKLKNVVQQKLDKALKFLQDVGTKHIPLPFQEFVNAACAIITPSLQFKDSDFFVYAFQNKEEHLAFSVYVELRGLVTTDTSDFYPKFYIVFTATLVPRDEKVYPQYQVTVLHDFAAPGTFNPGRSVEDPVTATRVVGTLLDLENVSTSIGVVPHNVDPKLKPSKFTVGKFIRTLAVDPDSLEFVLIPGLSTQKVNEVAQTLYTEVKAIIEVKNAKIKVKIFKDAMRVGKTRQENYVVRFTLSNIARDDQINVVDLDFLKEQFNLDDDKLRQVVRVINS